MIRWEWNCPTCGDFGTVDGERPTFSRCFHCDSLGGHMTPLLRIYSGAKITEKFEQLIKSEMEQTSKTSTHGKSQRAFGRKLLYRMYGLASYEETKKP